MVSPRLKVVQNTEATQLDMLANPTAASVVIGLIRVKITKRRMAWRVGRHQARKKTLVLSIAVGADGSPRCHTLYPSWWHAALQLRLTRRWLRAQAGGPRLPSCRRTTHQCLTQPSCRSRSGAVPSAGTGPPFYSCDVCKPLNLPIQYLLYILNTNLM